MIGRVTFLHSDKETAPCGTYLTFRFQGERNPHPVVQDLGRRGVHRQGRTMRRGPSKLNIVGGGYRAGRLIKALCIHECHSSRPIPMTVEQGPDDTAVDHARKGLVMVSWNEVHGQPVRCPKRVDLKAVFVGWTASKTNRGWSIGPLHTEVAHGRKTGDTILGSSLKKKTER